MDDRGRSAPGSAVDLESSAHALDAHAVRRQSDVPVREAIGELALVEPLAVVSHAEDDLAVLVREAQPDLARVRVLGSIGQKLAGNRQEQPLLRMWTVVAEIAMEPEASTPRGTSADRR